MRPERHIVGPDSRLRVLGVAGSILGADKGRGIEADGGGEVGDETEEVE